MKIYKHFMVNLAIQHFYLHDVLQFNLPKMVKFYEAFWKQFQVNDSELNMIQQYDKAHPKGDKDAQKIIFSFKDNLEHFNAYIC